MKKRLLSVITALALCLSLLPTAALAAESDGLCEHHPAHDDECGYTEGTAGTPCSHEHTDDCYTEVTDCVHGHTEDCYPQNSVSGNNTDEPTECTHVCSEESGCITKQLNCQHEHDEDCGYTPATAGTPCGYVCEICGAEDNSAEAMTVERVQAMIDALPDAEEITEDNAEEVTAQLEAIDEAKAELTDEEIDELDITRYMAAAAALGSLAAPMLLANAAPAEQFNLTPGGTYWFDLSGENIPGTVNTGNRYGAVSVPDATLHYVPFTYAGTVDAYKLTSEIATTEDYAEQNKYPHSLFVADYAVTHTVSWSELSAAGLIFGRSYTGGSVDYTLRAPSMGSWYTGSGDSERGTPQSNEWDAVLDKNIDYIKIWNGMYSWGQDAVGDLSSGLLWRAARGDSSAPRYWSHGHYAIMQTPGYGFRPVLEVLNADTLGPDGLKAVTLDLNGGKLGGSTDNIKIIVKNGAAFTAPASDGLTAPTGYNATGFKWQDSDGNLYAPGDSVPADVTTLTAQWSLAEQFNLTPGGTYWFDLSGENIPGTVNTGNSYGAVSVPDATLHYVPFTYAGTVDAYVLNSSSSGQTGAAAAASQTTDESGQYGYTYPHSLFVADYAVTHTVNWNELNTAGLIFGKSYIGGSVDYTLRAPSVGSWYTGSGYSRSGTPQSNEWDAVLDKNSDYIKNWNGMLSWGQDTVSGYSSYRANRGYYSARYWNFNYATFQSVYVGFRPVLEVLNTETLGPDGLKAVTLDLNGGKLGGSTDNIQIIVKNGAAFTAPASDGLTRPDGDTGSFFIWKGSNGNLYAPGDSVPADVTTLTAQWTPDTYTVTLHLNDGTIANGKDVTEYTYGIGATLPTADDITRDGFIFEGWYEDEGFSGSPVTEISTTDTGKKEFYAKWTLNTYTVTFDSQGGSTVNSQTVSHGGTVTEPTAPTREGYTFGDWYTEAGCTTEYDFTTAVTESLTLYAKWTRNTTPITPGDTVRYIVEHYKANGSGYTLADTEYPADKIGVIVTATPKTYDGFTYNAQISTASGTLKKISSADDIVTLKLYYDLTIYNVTVENDGHGTASASPASATMGEEITLTATPNNGYRFKEWQVVSGGVTISSDKFTMPTDNVTVKAIFERMSSGGSSTPSYSVTVPKTENGTITASPKSASRGGTVTITVTPDDGYTLETLTATDSKGNEIELTDKGNGKYTFQMPASKVTVEATFVPVETKPQPCDGGVTCPAYHFTDVDTSAWYHEAVDYVLVNGLMSGYGGGLFGPNDTLSRAMLAQILYNREGQPTTGSSGVFTDVTGDAWYSDAVTWANISGIVEGYGNGRFGPNDPITREQLAVMLYHYARFKGYDVSVGENTNILSYKDFDEISEWAIPALQWAAGDGVMNGYDGLLNPKGSATRAEAAQMLKNFLEHISK